MVARLDREIDELYALPLERFTAERNALAKRLRADGDRDAAERVADLAKPTRAAWIVNQLVREHRADVRALIDLGDRLRRAQRRAMSGRGVDEFRERSEERRRLISDLVEEARDYDGGPGAADDVAATLDAASADPVAGKTVLEGNLARPLPPPSGFGDITGFEVLVGGRSGERTRDRATDAERRKLERELRAAEDRERVARERVDALRTELEEAHARAAALRERLRAAEADARGAAMEVRRLRPRSG